MAKSKVHPAAGPAALSKAGKAARVPARQRRPAQPADALTLDRLIHERARLGIVSALATAPPHEPLTFNELKRLLDASDGNLSVHARKLEDAGYISCSKTFDGRVPRTEYRLTETGRRALARYLDHMEALIAAARKG